MPRQIGPGTESEQNQNTYTCSGYVRQYPRARPAHRLGVKERWEAGPPRCLLQRVGLVPTSVNFEGLTEWVWRPPAGGLKSGGPTALPPPSIPTKSLGSWDRRQLLHVQLEEVRLRDDRLLQEQMLRIYTHLGMLSRGLRKKVNELRQVAKAIAHHRRDSAPASEGSC